MNSEPVPFEALRDADLVVDQVYSGGRRGTAADDPIARLLPVGNQGGFRPAGSALKRTVTLCVLYTSGVESDWPDRLDATTGDFTYFGDNRRPGSQLLATGRNGNFLLQDVFERSNSDTGVRATVPPFLLFEKVGTRRDVRFRGLLAPGSRRPSPEEELVAVWRTTGGHRFQNYRAHFTVLDLPVVSRHWMNETLAGDPLGPNCPSVWRTWVDGVFVPLEAPNSVVVRRRVEQLPTTVVGRTLIEAIWRHFSEDPHRFESFAADLWLMSDSRVASVDVTRPSRDGGRDATGEFFVGPLSDPVKVEFALEAKCYAWTSGVGVGDVSRLISRLRSRQFGVLVTTSYLAEQAYKEVRQDGHPIVVIAAVDIVDILSAVGIRTERELLDYLAANHRVTTAGTPEVDSMRVSFDVEAHDIQPAPAYAPKPHDLDQTAINPPDLIIHPAL
jgi:hypothetical protein